MAKPAPTYDLMLLLDTNVEEETRSKILADTEALIARDGNVVSKHGWGRRALAYEIEKKTDAEYSLLQFEGPPALLKELDRVLRITDGVVRFRIIKLAAGIGEVPDLSAPAAAPEAAAPESQPVQAL